MEMWWHRLLFVLLVYAVSSEGFAQQPSVGYTTFRTDLPGGRHPNVRTMRAMVIQADGTKRREIASH